MTIAFIDLVKRYEAHWADCAWQPE